MRLKKCFKQIEAVCALFQKHLQTTGMCTGVCPYKCTHQTAVLVRTHHSGSDSQTSLKDPYFGVPTLFLNSNSFCMQQYFQMWHVNYAYF